MSDYQRALCDHPAHTVKLDDGHEDRRGQVAQIRHPTPGWAIVGDPPRCQWIEPECTGFVHNGIVTSRRADGTNAEYHQGAPCPTCRPGRRAVWAAGLDHEHGAPKADWPNDRRAREVFYVAEGRWPSWVDRRGERRDGPMPGDSELVSENHDRRYGG